MNYQPYWTAALKRHKALIAAGCISPVGARRVAPGKQEQEEDQDGTTTRPEER